MLSPKVLKRQAEARGVSVTKGLALKGLNTPYTDTGHAG